MNWLLILVILSIAFAVAVGIISSIGNPRAAFGRLNFNPLETWKIDYLGRHPEIVVARPKLMFLGLSRDELGLIFDDEQRIYRIHLTKVVSASRETAESISAMGMMLLGPLAFALKQKKNYLRVTFTNALGEQSMMLFAGERADYIAQRIMQVRYTLLSQEPASV